MGRLKNKLFAKLFTRYPALLEKYAERLESRVDLDTGDIPWAEIKKPLNECRVALITTAGLHLTSQTPFDMSDEEGDPTWRELPKDTPIEDYTITHDYYDHTDAERDINIVFPVERLGEMADEGVIGSVATVNYGFMGHIDGDYIKVLANATAPDVAGKLLAEGVDIALLTPG